MSEPILLERNGQIATVILNRPQQRNAITFDMWRQLHGIARTLDADTEVRAVVFRGAGEKAFSAGADIAEFETHRNNSGLARKYAEVFEGALDAVAAIGKPTISLIRGFCVGGGLELATATDLRLAAEDSLFGVPVAKLGILVGYKEMRRLVALVGPGPAMDLLLTARFVNASEALRLGLVSELAPATEVDGRVDDIARRLCGLAPLSARWHKKILQILLNNPALSDLSLDEEALTFACFDTADFQEGRRAFLEKRKPKFEAK